jgi:hypothetical protein
MQGALLLLLSQLVTERGNNARTSHQGAPVELHATVVT